MSGEAQLIAGALCGVSIMLILASLSNAALRARMRALEASTEFVYGSGFAFAVRDLLRLKDLKEQIERDAAQGRVNQANVDYYEKNKEQAWKIVRAYYEKLQSLQKLAA